MKYQRNPGENELLLEPIYSNSVQVSLIIKSSFLADIDQNLFVFVSEINWLTPSYCRRFPRLFRRKDRFGDKGHFGDKSRLLDEAAWATRPFWW